MHSSLLSSTVSPHRSSRSNPSSTPCSIFIIRFCAKARLRPSPSLHCLYLSWNRLLTTTPLSSARTCPAPPRSAAAAEYLPPVAVSRAPPPTPISPKEGSISSWRRPTSSILILMPPLPRPPLASHPPLSARRHCLITIIIATTTILIIPTIIMPRLRPPHLKVAPMRLWGSLHPFWPQIVSAVAGAEMEGFLFWEGSHLRPLPAEVGVQAACHKRPPQRHPLTWGTFAEVSGGRWRTAVWWRALALGSGWADWGISYRAAPTTMAG